jgi:hypothetical protein
MLHNDERRDTFEGIVAWDPNIGTDPYSDAARIYVGYASRVFNHYVSNLDGLIPYDSLVNTGYCMAEVGSEYVVYLEYASSVTVDLTALQGTAIARFYNPYTGSFNDDDQIIDGGSQTTFTAPDSSQVWILLIQDESLLTKEGTNCDDGTINASCSTTKPLYCQDETLIDNCAECGCENEEICQEDGSCTVEICSDNTPYDVCSTVNIGKFCDEGTLVDKCSECGCADNYGCEEDDTCVQKCSDDTLSSFCSTANIGQFCDEGTLIDRCNTCGCPTGTSCCDYVLTANPLYNTCDATC